MMEGKAGDDHFVLSSLLYEGNFASNHFPLGLLVIVIVNASLVAH
jgi:hypothetical protein